LRFKTGISRDSRGAGDPAVHCVTNMRPSLSAAVFVLLAACSTGTPIKDVPDENVSKKASQWTDPGATPDEPRDLDAGGMDAGPDASEPAPDATTQEPEASVPDASPPDANVDGSAPDAGTDAGADGG